KRITCRRQMTTGNTLSKQRKTGAEKMSSAETYEGEIVENSTELVHAAGAVVSLAGWQREEIDIQIATAKRYPRSITAFKRQCLEMATLDEETAGSMYYVLPRAGKKIEGPSVRLAEIAGSAWGNLRSKSYIVEV